MKVPNIRALPLYLDFCSASGSVTGSRQLFENDKDRVFQRNHMSRVGRKEQHEMSKRSWKLAELEYNQYRNYENGQSSAVLGSIRTAAEMEKLLESDGDKQIVINFSLEMPEQKRDKINIKDIVKKKDK